jgi:hypothetical protein
MVSAPLLADKVGKLRPSDPLQGRWSGRQGRNLAGEAATKFSRSQVQPCQLLVSDM